MKTIVNTLDKSDFLKFEFVIDRNNVAGSYTLQNEKGEELGYAEGYVMKHRSILFKLEQTQNTYEIIKRSKGHYLIMRGEDVEAAFKLNRRYALVELRTSKENVIEFHPKNNNKTFKINHKKLEIGLVNTNNWHTENVGVALKSNYKYEIILCTILGIAFHAQTSFKIFLSDL